MCDRNQARVAFLCLTPPRERGTSTSTQVGPCQGTRAHRFLVHFLGIQSAGGNGGDQFLGSLVT